MKKLYMLIVISIVIGIGTYFFVNGGSSRSEMYTSLSGDIDLLDVNLKTFEDLNDDTFRFENVGKISLSIVEITQEMEDKRQALTDEEFKELHARLDLIKESSMNRFSRNVENQMEKMKQMLINGSGQ